MSMQDIVHNDPRRRNLLLLGLAAIIAVGLAVGALWNEASELAPPAVHEPLFPKFGDHMRDVARIHIESKHGGAFDVTFQPDAGWVLPGHDNYPADYNEVRKIKLGTAAMEILEPKTARADWLHYLHLNPPPKGDGTLIVLMDEKGKALAAYIAGKTEDIGSSDGAIGMFVRKPDSNQSWLVRSVVEPDSNPANWFDKDVLDVDRARIQQTDITPADGPSFAVYRDKQSDADFKIQDMPKGRDLAFPSAADGPATAIAAFTFEDVKPAKDMDFDNASRIVTRTFDGLVVTVDAIKQGDAVWATVSATALPGKTGAAHEARAIDARANGWAYKLPNFKGQQFMSSLDSLLKPLDKTSAARK